MQPVNQVVHYLKVSPYTVVTQQVKVVCETPVNLSVNGEIWLKLTCTPSLLEELGAGFLFNENIIQSRNEISSIHICQDSTLIDIWLNHPTVKPEHWTRTSGCSGGLTGAALPILPIPGTAQFPIEGILEIMHQMQNSQAIYREGGGLHCSALSDGISLRTVAEDVGRHNTLDKLAGYLLNQEKPLKELIVLTTGRISSEMIQKAVRMRAAVIVSRTSPTHLALQIGENAGVTIIGYARQNQCNIYTHPERMCFPDPCPAFANTNALNV
jgi:FdhD protein